LGEINHLAGAEHLGAGLHFRVDFETDDGFVVHVYLFGSFLDRLTGLTVSFNEGRHLFQGSFNFFKAVA